MGQFDGYLDYVDFDDRLTPQERIDRGPFQAAYAVGHGDKGAAAIERAKQQAAIAKGVLGWVKEQAVFALLVDGLSVRDAAAQLGIPKSEVHRIAKRYERDDDGRWISHASLIASSAGRPDGMEVARSGVVDAWTDR